MNFPPFDKVFIDPEVEALHFTRNFLDRLPSATSVRVLNPGELPPKGKRVVLVTRELGAFVKSCPCSPGMVGCGYRLISPVFQCPYNCEYCFLRVYAPETSLVLYANLEDAEIEFHQAAAKWSGRIRLGSGEFADSLALDPWTRHANWLIGLVESRPNVRLELKTKSANIEGLLQQRPLPNVVLAWSLNPEEIIGKYESDAPSLASRLTAAATVAKGWKVAFHFDPIILEGDWKREYAAVIQSVFDVVSPADIAWISLGTLRFPPGFVESLGPALKGKKAFFDEFVPGEDGKLRYLWHRRREAYRFMFSRLKKIGLNEEKIYLCMESPASWNAGIRHHPSVGAPSFPR